MAEMSKEELTERAQLVRVMEAVAKIEYPTKDEANFRLAVMKKLGVSFGLREVRDKEITGPTTSDAQRPPARR